MREPRTDPELVMQVATQNPHGGTTQLVGTVVYRDPEDRVRLLSPLFGFNEPYADYADLHISSYIVEPLEGSAYGDTISFRPYQVELGRAEPMVKTLRRINRGLERLDQQLGRSPDFATSLIRVAHVIGCATFAEYFEELRADGSHYRWMDPDSVRWWITEKINARDSDTLSA
ncbi:hypothetical protein [Actinomadura hibisca]|uniref:hypothetical protein n=1 Tax=Actinomadura hibisca TaxID=68565 RepID=UPI00082D304C|nr:hypothetical protein [Actinomadura hibisca]